ncbi:hypothetical protein [Burkholderia sp. PU8-34]
MTNGIDNRDNHAKAQFDEAARRLEAAEVRVRALSINPLADEAALQTALEAYEMARLLWLSSEAVLRSAVVTNGQPQHIGKCVVILHGNEHVGESIALLLRLRGFGTTAIPSNRLERAIRHGPAAAVIFDIERDPRDACVLAANSFDTYPDARIIGIVPPTLENYDWRGFDTILVKPTSIDMIVWAIVSDAGS